MTFPKFLVSPRQTCLHRLIRQKKLIRQPSDKKPAPSAPAAVQENEPTCPVCREKFENPKMMPKCGHSLCESCEVKISVQDPIQKKKTLTCPMCRQAVQLNIDEYLPVNWIAKDLLALYNRGGPIKGSEHTLECSSCNEPLSEKKTFDCEFCAQRDQKIEVLICAACAFLHHNEHSSIVKRVTFADAAYKKGKIGGISRDPEEPRHEKASTLMEVNKEFDVFFGDLEKDYERVNSRLQKLGGDCPMTQKATDKESEELMKVDGVIKKKLEKLSIWKTTLWNISQLNNDERHQVYNRIMNKQ
ncbi:hypothetical protein QR680_014885 [Steinernema hermaphroditum]|uniref:RING-type domain-containing protein n=1 Tax=Steinernema hermaphroditum TaxID=289476 RepID=A0AA39M511_9BILA|nr:hypothetical protein QR680_014885 [Steinernema hermaphroditum]